MSSVQVRYVSIKTDNAFLFGGRTGGRKPLVTGSNPVCAYRKSIVRVEMSKVSFIFGLVAQFGSATALQAEGLRVRVSSGPLHYAFQSKPGDWTRLKPGVAQSDSEGRH